MSTSPPPVISVPVPVTLQVDVLDRMVNLEFADSALYGGLEVQGFDDPVHGTGIVVFFERAADSKVDVYYQSGLRLDPRRYGIGGGLGEWVETDFEIAQFSLDDNGTNVHVRFADLEDRSIEIRINDRTRQPRRWASFLAPGGAAIAEPESLPLWWMSRFDLLRRAGTAPVICIDGNDVKPGRLPGEWFLRRRLIKVASDIFIVELNPCDATGEIPSDQIVTREGGVEAIVANAGVHEARVQFNPPFHHLDGAQGVSGGAWNVTIDDRPIIAGTWNSSRRDDKEQLTLEVTDGWRPTGLPLFMRVVTRVVSVFRKWPTTYRWHGILASGETRAPIGKWERIGDERGGSYRSLTKSRRTQTRAETDVADNDGERP